MFRVQDLRGRIDRLIAKLFETKGKRGTLSLELGGRNDGTDFGTGRALGKAASLTEMLKTPPPTLLRARFATVLGHLPSVPSVVLPFMGPVIPDRAHLLLNV